MQGFILYFVAPWVAVTGAVLLILISVAVLQDWALAAFGAAGLVLAFLYLRKVPALRARDERRDPGR